ncbi:hypothetical protein B0I37DRAFT_191758 [Chaetomium sp. MPI-CAGE-AT-0009]|nr:hypothetical protein B0I37DRAFT_191758 [Chaetomium sp. MPI-CAGE-AT-0009]
MSSSESSPDHTPQPRMVVQNFYIPDAAADEIDLANHPWLMATTVIDDDDLMFGGKPLCAWYEEDRRMLSLAMDDEETRGRPRERSRGDRHQQPHQQPQHQHQLEHQHGRHHSEKSTEPKQ